MMNAVGACLRTILLVFPFLVFVTGAGLLGENGDKDRQNSKKQPPKKESERAPAFTFKVPVEVVVVNAVVTDRKGNPVKDLTVNDFKIYEDGKPQTVHTFALESYKSLQITDESGRVPGEKPPVQDESSFSQPRFISLFLDDFTMGSLDILPRALESIQKFIEEDLGPGDQLSILAASGRTQLPFTSDKAALLDFVSQLYKKLNVGMVTRPDCPALTDLQAYRIHNQHPDTRSLDVAAMEVMVCDGSDSQQATPAQIEAARQAALARVRSYASQLYEETQYRNRILLGVLRQHVRSLRHLDGKKSLILFSDGFLSEDVRYELQDVVDMALRSGVIINAVDIRGLYVSSYQANDRVIVGATPEQQLVLSQKPMLHSENLTAQADPLGLLAQETGGIFFQNNNDLYSGVRKISANQSFYYVLTYASPTSKSDGRYHKIKLEVNRPGLRVVHRKGYYAPKEQISFERRKKEDIMEALHAPASLNEIPVQLSYNYHQVDESRYQLALLTRVNIRGLQFLEEDSRHKNLFHLVVVAFDENDRYVDGLEKSMELNLSEPSYAAMLHFGFTSKVNIRVPAGRYKIKAVVREGHRTKMGSINKTIEVP